MDSETNNYYQSHSKLPNIGATGQAKLSAAKVLVIGAGGLGCPCLLMLATAGVGTIGIADYDTVAMSNLHRQTLYTANDVGKPKAPTARVKLLQHNPHIVVNEYDELVDETNVLQLIEKYDLVVDGTDNFAVRYLINDACVYLNKPLVYGAIYQAEGHLTVFNVADSPTLRCLFDEPNGESYVPSCADVGAYHIVTQVIGAMMANEVIKLITGNKPGLAGKLLTYDAMDATTQTIAYNLKPQSRAISRARFEQPEKATDITVEDFLKLPKGTYTLLDVREEWEREDFDIGGVHLPLAGIADFDTSGLAPADNIVVYCEQGTRSAAAVQYLHKKGLTNAKSLRGGLKVYKLHT